MGDRYATYSLNAARPSGAIHKASKVPHTSHTNPQHTGFLGPEPTGYSRYISRFFQYSFYLTIICLLSFVLLIVLQFMGFKTFSLLPDDGGLITVPLLPTNRQVSFPKGLMAANASANFLHTVPSNYTISFDVFIQSNFVDPSIPRVLLYRALSPVILTSSDTTIGRIANKMPQTNFILYLDPYTNDLMANVYVMPSDALSGSPSGSPSGTPSGSPSGSSVRVISMPSIKNVPIKTPFRITMMLSDILLEVYINGDLQKSVPLIGGSPITVPSNSNFYGPPSIVGQSVAISNLSFWNTPLSSHSIRTYGKEAFNSTVFTN